jgi:hypothetical protein
MRRTNILRFHHIVPATLSTTIHPLYSSCISTGSSFAVMLYKLQLIQRGIALPHHRR